MPQQETTIKKFLEFNGKNIYFKSVNGVYWIAIKPICEALNIDYSRQLRTLKSDIILGQLWSLETIVAADNRMREMACLPEFYVYGWIFSIQSDSTELQQYKWKCYELLFNYFNGTISGRTGMLKEKSLNQIEIEKLQEKLSENEDYKNLIELKRASKQTDRQLLALDKQYVRGQLELWGAEN